MFEDAETAFGITIKPATNGSIAVDKQPAERGATVTFTVIADAGYKLRPASLKVITDKQQAPRVVRGEGTSLSPYTFIMPGDSVTVTAEFVKISSITVASGITHGAVKTSVDSAVVGELVTISLAPDEGYRLRFDATLSSWNGVGKTLRAKFGSTDTDVNIPESYYDPETRITTNLNVLATSYSFTMPADDVVITAEFALAYNIIIDSNIAHGSIALEGRTKATAGEKVPANAVADAGYSLKTNTFKATDAQGNESFAYNQYAEYIMGTSDLTITAEFVALPFLDNINFTAIAGDSEVILNWALLPEVGWNQYQLFYRIKGSNDVYQSQGFYSTTTRTISNLTNDVEYEFYLQVLGAVSSTVYATPAAIIPTDVVLIRSSATVVLGETVQLYATVLPDNSKSKGVTWTSSNEDVAVVGSHGGIETKSLGYTEVIVTTDLGGKTASCDVYVVKSSETPSGGSMIIGTANTTYNENGGTATLPLTIIVPTNRPIFEMDFNLAVNNSYFNITGISLDQTALSGNRITAVGNTNVRVGSLPLTSNVYDAWIVLTPTEGRFLEAGKTYNFTLTMAIKGTAIPVIPVNFGNSGNYSATVYYYDYDYSPNKDRFAPVALKQNGAVNATWTGSGVPSTGTGANTTYLISTASDFLYYTDLINGGTAARAMLYQDIDLTSTSFDGLGTADHPLESIFSGNGHTITYSLTQSSNGAVGFIRYTSGGAQVRDLTTKGTINVTGGTVNAGGVVGEVRPGYTSISGCTNEVTINVTGLAGGYVGGIVGLVDFTPGMPWKGSVQSNKNLGVIAADGTGVLAVGGIVGRITDGGVGGNNNNGSVTGKGFVGGIIGISENTEVNGIGSNSNSATITGLQGSATGGIAGKVVKANIGGSWSGSTRAEEANRNYGAITGTTAYVAGIVACVDDTGSERISLNYNEGTITNTSTVNDAALGGIIAHITGSATLTIHDNINKGALVGGSTVIKGGVLGKTDYALTEALCYGNYYASVDGLTDTVFGVAAPASWLSFYGYEPQYSGTGGDGSAENPFLIATIDDFLWFTKQVNTGLSPSSSPGMNYNIKLVTDIDLSNYPAFEGIGTNFYPAQTFMGTLDGNGHTINVAFDSAAPGSRGSLAIFNRAADATVKNLTITGYVNAVQSGAGLALNFDGGTLENVHNYADITADSGTAAGVIIGSGAKIFKNVTNHGIIHGGAAAGIVQNIITSTVIEDCANYGDVTGLRLAAGIVGSVVLGGKSTDGIADIIIKNSVNYGTITSLASVVLDNVDWNNLVDASPGHSAGGIIGQVSNAIVEINNVTNNGTVQGTGNNVGGILGARNYGDYQDTDFRIINSTNNGAVKSLYDGDDPWYLSHISVGGIVGNAGGNFGPSTPQDPYGVKGSMGKGTITGSVNNGIISGPAGINAGSIAGLLITDPNSRGVLIGDNYTTITVDNNTADAFNGAYYDPTIYKIENGKLVEINPKPPVEPDPEKPLNPGAVSINPDSSLSLTDEPVPVVTANPVQTPATPANPVETPATPANPSSINPSNTPTSDSSATAGEGSKQTFFEIVSEVVANNPVAVIAIIVAAAALACAGGIWRYRRTSKEG